MACPLSDAETVFVARQPVFLADETLWGYELLFRSSACVEGRFDDSVATSSVVADGFALASESLDSSLNFLINFAEELLVDGTPKLLPPNRCIIEILEFVSPTPQILQAIGELKSLGYRVAVDDFVGQESLLPFVKLADIVKVDVLQLKNDPDRIRAALAAISGGNKPMILAEKVEDKETATFLREMGFDLFQGFYFSKPEIVPGKKPATSELAKLQLLQELGKDPLETKRLVEILQTEASLSYRLFRYINSAGFSLREKMNSLNRAVTYLGQRQTAQWIRAAILSEMVTGPSTAELALMAVQRARFFELLAEYNIKGCASTESAFILGLFSLLDAMMGVKMEDILSPLPLDDEIVRSLIGGNAECPMLELAENYEHANWQGVTERLADMGLNPDDVDALYVKAREWAQSIVGMK